MSHDERYQAGASARSVSISSLVLRRPAQAKSTEASGKGCHIGATRPRPEDGKVEVIVEPKTASPQSFSQAKTAFVRIACTSCPPSNLPAVVGSLPVHYFGKRTRAYISRASHHSRGRLN